MNLTLHHLLLSSAALVAAASADVIVWGPALDSVAPTDVRLAGTLVTARNTWSGTSVSPTVNGVTFTAFAPTGWTNGATPTLNTSTTGDTGYDALLNSARATSEAAISNPTGWGAIRLDTLGTLTLGSHYEVQVWYTDQRPGTAANPLNDRRMTLSSAVGTATLTGGIVTNLGALVQGPMSGTLDADPDNTFGALDTAFGQHCVGTFQRTSADPLYLLVQGSHPITTANLRPHLNAFQVREVPPPPIGTNYCAAALNSTGVAAAMSATGSNVVTSNDLTLVASDLPLGSFSFFIASTTQDFVAMAGGSAGNLCLGGNIGRGVGGAILSSGATGVVSILADLTQMPTPTGPLAVVAGETWNFQCWFRDSVGGAATSNFSDAYSVTFN